MDENLQICYKMFFAIFGIGIGVACAIMLVFKIDAYAQRCSWETKSVEPYIWRCPVRGLYHIRRDTIRGPVFLYNLTAPPQYVEGLHLALAWSQWAYAEETLCHITRRSSVAKAKEEVKIAGQRFIDKVLT